MNRKSLYLEIGNIDDDLILEASEAQGHRVRKINFVRLAGMAACLCLICTAVFFGMHRDVVYYNTASAPLASKVLVPSDENTTVLTLTYEELFDYYALEPFPDSLSGLLRVEQPHYYVYKSSESTIYDTNILNYRSTDGEQTLSILLSKAEPDERQENLKESRIDGISFVLAVSNTSAKKPTQPTYWAEICDQGVFLRVVSSGIDESSFTDIIREIIQFQE